MTPTPALDVVAADPAWTSIDFVSDLHLAADTPRTTAAFAAYLRGTTASAVFVLGDLFEVWVGDDARFEGFEAEGTALLREAAARRPMAFLHGNRDFLVGAAWLADTGITGLADPCRLDVFGHRLLLTHGDELCVADTEYQAFRALVRADRWQRDFLARPLAERRETARAIRGESQRRQVGREPADYADVDPPTAIEWLRSSGADTMVHGHTHRPATSALSTEPGAPLRHVLSDWDLDHGGSPRAEVLRLDAAGFRRLTPQQASTDTPC